MSNVAHKTRAALTIILTLVVLNVFLWLAGILWPSSSNEIPPFLQFIGLGYLVAGVLGLPLLIAVVKAFRRDLQQKRIAVEFRTLLLLTPLVSTFAIVLVTAKNEGLHGALAMKFWVYLVPLIVLSMVNISIFRQARKTAVLASLLILAIYISCYVVSGLAYVRM